jgi:uncharacterized membrane protein
MLWFVLSLATAFFKSMEGVFGKRGLKNIDEYAVGWSMRTFSLILIVPFLLLTGMPEIDAVFYPSLILTSIIQVVTTVLYFRAIRHSDLSITVPIVTFSPLFLLITSPLMLGWKEFPSGLGLGGVLMIVLGSYILNIKERHKGYAAPFRALLTEKGPRYMLMVVFLWSITSNIDKIGVLSSSPAMWLFAVNALIALLLTPTVIRGERRAGLKINMALLVPIGLVSGLYMIFQNIAIILTLVPYVISIKNTSVLMSVFFGWLIFKERGMRERLLGTIIMVLGVALIALG